MISIFSLQRNRLIKTPCTGAEDLKRDHVLWIDLLDPTEEEREMVQTAFRLDLPDDEELQEIEASARYFQDEQGVHIRAAFLQEIEGQVENIGVSFLLAQGRLLTIHEEDLLPMRLFRLRARAGMSQVTSAVDILLAIYELAIEKDADVLEAVYLALDLVGRQVLRHDEIMTDRVMRENVAKIAAQEDLNGKVRLDLMDNRRALSFLLRSSTLLAHHSDMLYSILRDIESLSSHSAFLFEKINFLMDALLGLINLEQNRTIKSFSIASVVFLPPTLLASIYGMNFKYMPEMSWTFGYPLAIGLMAVAGVAPYLYFKHRGWLR